MEIEKLGHQLHISCMYNYMALALLMCQVRVSSIGEYILPPELFQTVLYFPKMFADTVRLGRMREKYNWPVANQIGQVKKSCVTPKTMLYYTRFYEK